MLFNEEWEVKLQPILELYKGRKHPLDYENPYQLMIMVVLSAQDSDANINKIAPSLFEKFPNMESLSQSNIDGLSSYITKVRNYPTKASWIIDIAQTIKKDKNIPKNLKDLTALKGIGRKSANVILRELNMPAEGIIADLHVIRVSPKIVLTSNSKDRNKNEKN